MNTKPITYQVPSLAAWATIAQTLLAQAGPLRTWCFQGTLGAGKTTLIQALSRHLGVSQPITSPTFGLIHTYDTERNFNIYHCDFYRLETFAATVEVGFENCLTDKDYTFIEWPAVVLPWLPLPYFQVEITGTSLTERTVTAQWVTVH